VGGLKEKGILVINSSRPCQELLATFPPQIQSLIKYRQIRVFTLDATRVALQHLNRNLPGAAILGLVNKELGILPEKEFEQRFKKILEKKLGGRKGKDIIDDNLALLRYGTQQGTSGSVEKAAAVAISADLPDYSPPLPEDFGRGPGTAGLPFRFTEKDELGTIQPIPLLDNYQEVFYRRMIKPVMEGKKVPWDRFLPVVPAATSRFRDMSYIGTQVPLYDPNKCIACGLCAASCPDAAIFCLVTPEEVPAEAKRYFKIFRKPPKGVPWDRFAMNIEADPKACKGCGVCALVCPTDALHMVDKTKITPLDFLPEEYRKNTGIWTAPWSWPRTWTGCP